MHSSSDVTLISMLGLEGALKLKEISYIQAEGFAGGEIKARYNRFN